MSDARDASVPRPRRPDDDGPWLQAAFFCDQAVKDPNEIFSFGGVHDGCVTVGGDGAHVTPLLVLMFTGGETPRTVWLSIQARGPWWPGVVEAIVPQILRFDGPRTGHTMISRIRIPTEQDGTVWLDVRIDDDVVTRMPFNVTVEP